MRWAVWGLLALSACGRWNFDPLTDGGGGGGGGDGSADANPCGHTFCDDFVHPSGIPQERWDGVSSSNNATTTLQGDQLHVLVPATSDGRFLVKAFPAPTTRVRVGFSIAYTSTTPGIAEIDLVHLKWFPPPAGCSEFGAYLVRNGDVAGRFDLQESYAPSACGSNFDTNIRNLDNSGPHNVAMTVTLGPPSTVRVDIDNVMQFEMPTQKTLPSQTLLLELGGGAPRDVQTPWTIIYDDVYVDIE